MTIIPILLYHSVHTDPPDWIAPFTVSPANFVRHIELIHESGRTAMTASDLVRALRHEIPLPERPVVVTFDDGFADFANAAAVLAEHLVPATLYVTTGAMRGRGPLPDDMALPAATMLDWSQLPELVEQGIEIGAHTHTHPQLDILRSPAAADEIVRSKHMLEDALGREVPSFAYPHGFQSTRIRRLVADSGHHSACAVINALSSESDDPYALARLTVRNDTRSEDIAAWLSGDNARVAPHRERWRTTAWRCYRRMGAPGSGSGVIAHSKSQEAKEF